MTTKLGKASSDLTMVSRWKNIFPIDVAISYVQVEQINRLW